MRKHLLTLAVIAATALTASPALADGGPLEKGKDFLDNCAQPVSAAWDSMCIGYVAGLHDAIMDLRDLKVIPACPAHTGPTYGEIRARMIAFMRKNPDVLAEETFVSYFISMDEISPCPKPSPIVQNNTAPVVKY